MCQSLDEFATVSLWKFRPPATGFTWLDFSTGDTMQLTPIICKIPFCSLSSSIHGSVQGGKAQQIIGVLVRKIDFNSHHPNKLSSQAPDKDFQMTLTSFNSLRPWWHTPPTPCYRPICALLRNIKEQFAPAIENTKHKMRKTLNTSIDHCRPIRPWRVKVSDVNQTHIAVSVGMIRNHENQLALSWPWHYNVAHFVCV